jgi:hypothetical protein
MATNNTYYGLLVDSETNKAEIIGPFNPRELTKEFVNSHMKEYTRIVYLSIEQMRQIKPVFDALGVLEELTLKLEG